MFGLIICVPAFAIALLLAFFSGDLRSWIEDVKRKYGDGVYDCLVCGSEDLDKPREGFYTCRLCGYEGGADRAAAEVEQSRQRWRALPLGERTRSAMDELRAAKNFLHEQPSGLHNLLNRTMRAQSRWDRNKGVMWAAYCLREAEIKLDGLNALDPEIDYVEIAMSAKSDDFEPLRRRFLTEIDEAIGKLRELQSGP